MAITTGSRRGELARLTWADVELERAIAYARDIPVPQDRQLGDSTRGE